MSTTQAFFALTIVNSLSLYFSFRMKRLWSGDGYSYARWRRALVFLIVVAYFNATNPFAEQIISTTALYGPPLKATAFILMLIQVTNLPTHRSGRPPNKKSNNAITLKPARRVIETYAEALFFKMVEIVLMTVVLFVISCLLLGALLQWIFPAILPLSELYRSTFFTICSVLAGLGAYRIYRKRPR